MDFELKHLYTESYAIVIGVNNYKNASPLQYAVNDAQAISDLLIHKFGFKELNVSLFLDDQATSTNIMREYLSFAKSDIDVNSRLIFFFAGHGHTLPSPRGEVGFLVPFDGDMDDLSSMIRWDQLTRNADLVPSKHILFLMDACYGGLAITRSMRPGATRFLRDMLIRFSRQVITAGKADEVVADLGGPMPNHSVFTGYLLEALSGGAIDSEGILTANGVMAYVYRHVGQDPDSNQTPHFGYLNGDGDLIFDAPIFAEEHVNDNEVEDVLFAVPFPPLGLEGLNNMSTADRTKELLSEPKNRIHLHDLVIDKTREAMAMTDDEAFPVQGTWSVEEFDDRLKKYEIASDDLQSISALFGYWGTTESMEIMTLPARRMAGRIIQVSGLNIWLSLRWYPIFLMTYCFGISAVASSNYRNLRDFFRVPIQDPRKGGESPLVLSVISGVGDLNNAFKSLPEHEKQYVPHSEYLYKKIQPKLDDLLFLGNEYGSLFDRFELFLGLEYAHLNEKHGSNFWGPKGRFGWKHFRSLGKSPFVSLVEESILEKEEWLPLKSGLFDGSFERFQTVSAAFADQLEKLGWH